MATLEFPEFIVSGNFNPKYAKKVATLQDLESESDCDEDMPEPTWRLTTR